MKGILNASFKIHTGMRKPAGIEASSTTKAVKGKLPTVRGPKPRKRAGSTSHANMVVAENIYRMRRARGLTQVQLCDFAVVNRSFYQRVEACTENVSIEYLEKLRPVLKCTWADFFKGLD